MAARIHAPTAGRFSRLLFSACIILILVGRANPPAALGQELSGTITYSGTRFVVSDDQPIHIILGTLTPGLGSVDDAYVSVNGGDFVLHASAPGEYGLFYSIDTHDYRNGSDSVGAPFEFYDNCYQFFSFPEPPACASLVTLPQAGVSLTFGDTAFISGIAGTVTYTGTQPNANRRLLVQAYSNPAFSGQPDRTYIYAHVSDGRYELDAMAPGTLHYLRAFVDFNSNRQLDPGEPFGECSNPVVAGTDQTDVSISFDDSGTARCLVPATPTSTPTPAYAPSPTPTPSPCVGDCNEDNSVTVDELLRMVNVALGNAGIEACNAGDANHDGSITIDEILKAVNNALSGCPNP
jgi:hypothetical protein